MSEKKPRIYFAPMEGITTITFRRVHHEFFPGIDCYFTAFLSANQTLHFKKKEIRDVDPANNVGIPTIPQIITNQADQFVWAVREMEKRGYEEVNLNLGCPFPMEVKKSKGAGFLADLDRLDRFFEEVFNELREDPVKISVKTRSGLTDHAEAAAIIDLYNRYPICEVSIHPRRQIDFYKGSADRDVFQQMLERSTHPVCYNGDINTLDDYNSLMTRFPGLEAVMIGRGLLKDPALAMKIHQGNEFTDADQKDYLRRYERALFKAYREYMQEEVQAVGKMKELWNHMVESTPEFDGKEKVFKKIRKARSIAEYESAVEMMLR